MIKLQYPVIDCPDTMGLARFYADLIGGEVTEDSDPGWATVVGPGVGLAFQQVPEYRAPQWPGQTVPQQMHLDFDVDDFETEGERAVRMGATFVERKVGESGTGFVVYTDPAGHPFCLCRDSG